MKALLLTVVFVFLFVLVGLAVFFPETIQPFASKVARMNLAATGAEVRAYVQSHDSLISARAAGLTAFAISVLLAVCLYRRAR